MQVTENNDYFEGIAKGLVPNHDFIYKFGRTLTIVGKRKPIWDGTGNYTFPTTAALITLSSTSGNDVPAGTGARTIEIEGLDGDYNQISETIDSDGTTTNTYLRVFRMRVVTSGTQLYPYDSTQIGNNVGVITATHAGTGLPIAIINAEMGQTLMAIYTIPAGCTGYMWTAKTAAAKGKSAVGFLLTRDNSVTDAAWNTKGIRDMYQNQVGNEFTMPPKYGEKTDLVLAIDGDASGDSITGTFQIELVKN